MRGETHVHYRLQADSLRLPIRSDSVDTIITDPPWHFKLRVSPSAKAVKATQYPLINDNDLSRHFFEMRRVLKPGGHLFLFCPVEKQDMAELCLRNVKTHIDPPVGQSQTRLALHQRTRVVENRLRAIDHLGGCCVDCGNEDARVLQFDHLRDKTCNISKLLQQSWLHVLEELLKCDLVCSNCHTIRTRDRQHGQEPQLTRHMREPQLMRVTSLVWVKTTKDRETPRIGLGHTVRMAHELILFWSNGRRRPMAQKNLPSVLGYARTGGSVKPAELYERLARASCAPGGVILDPWCGSDPLGRAGLSDYTTISGDIQQWEGAE